MSNLITFTFKSDAPWSDAELDDLNSELAKVAIEIDDDHVAGSFNVTLIDEDASDADAEKAKIRAAAIELINKGTLTVNVQITDEDDDEIVDSGDVVIAL